MPGSNHRTCGSIPRNGSDRGTGCRALCLLVGFLLLLRLLLLLGRGLLLGGRCWGWWRCLS
jgi:hypothetical protein